MRKYIVMIAVVTPFFCSLAKAEAVDMTGIVPAAQDEMQDKSKHDACDCCKKCMAAKSPIDSKHKEGPVLKDGCEDCCARCGKVLKPTQEATPPEIIEKKGAPDSIEKER